MDARAIARLRALGRAAIGAGRGARPWLLAGLVADAADLVGTLRVRDELSPPSAPAVGALAGGSVLLSWLLTALD